MRWPLLILIALLSIQPAWPKNDDDIVVGHLNRAGEEIELYNVQAACDSKDWRSASRYESPTKRAPYIMGCWRPTGPDTGVIKFEDGAIVRFELREIIRVRQPPRFSL